MKSHVSFVVFLFFNLISLKHSQFSHMAAVPSLTKNAARKPFLKEILNFGIQA
jgi:hypothetical protein